MGGRGEPGRDRPAHPYDRDGGGRDRPRRRWPRWAQALAWVAVLLLVAGGFWFRTFSYYSGLAEADGQPTRWADRAELQVTRVAGECDYLRGRYRPTEDRCPATWTVEGAPGAEVVDGWISDKFGSEMPDVDETVTARLTYTDGTKQVATTSFTTELAAYYADPAGSASDPFIAFGIVGALASPVFVGLWWWNRRLGRRPVSARRRRAASSR